MFNVECIASSARDVRFVSNPETASQSIRVSIIDIIIALHFTVRNVCCWFRTTHSSAHANANVQRTISLRRGAKLGNCVFRWDE